MDKLNKEQTAFLRVRASQALTTTIVALLSFFLLGSLFEATNSEAGGLFNPIVSAGLTQLLFMFVPMLWMVKKYGITRREVTRDGRVPKPLAWVYGLIGIVGIQAVNHGWNGAVPMLLPLEWAEAWREMQALYDSAIGQFMSDVSLLTIVLTCLTLAVIPAVVEELLFRGVLQSSLERAGNPARAIVTTSIFFALAHAYPPNLPALFLMGLWLGYLAYYTQSLHMPVYLHLLNNGLAVFVMFSFGAEVSTATVESGTLTEYSIFLMLGVVLLGLGFWGIQNHITQVDSNIQHYLPSELRNQ